MEASYPAAASALARGRRARRSQPRSRHRTQPVTFAEIKEVDEDNEEAVVTEERRRRPDVLGERLDERLGRQWAEFRRRRDVLRERADEPPASAGPVARAASQPHLPL